MKPSDNSLTLRTKAFSPFAYQSSCAVCSEVSVSSVVNVLLFIGCPSAVLRAVSFAVVDTVNGRFRRGTRTHVSQELREIIAPLFANRDTSSAIIRVSIIARVVAAVKDTLPSVVFRRSTHAMLSVNFNSLFSSKAAARNTNAINEFVAAHAGDVSALAQASKMVGVGWRDSSEIFKNCPSCKYISDLRCHVLIITFGVMFWTGLLAFLLASGGRAVI